MDCGSGFGGDVDLCFGGKSGSHDDGGLCPGGGGR